jgi:ABC-type transport system involved in multi-copper enzyme maturation permease subunit
VWQVDSYPTIQLLLCALFVCSWALVVKARAWPITRMSLGLIFRRKLFWALYALALIVFLGFFFGQYLMAWATTQLGTQDVRVSGIRANPRVLVGFLSNLLKLNGSAATFRNFMNAEANTVMIVLVLAGSILIGNDLRYGSMPFFLAKPISSWDYLLGKGLAVAVFVNLFTTIPAIILFVQYGLLESWDYFFDESELLVGILSYGAVLTLTFTLLLLAMATWLRRTVPLIMTWTALFSFCGIVARVLVDGLHWHPRWRLIDVWNSTSTLGHSFLPLKQHTPGPPPPPQPDVTEAAIILSAVCLSCLAFLIARIRAVEVVK